MSMSVVSRASAAACSRPSSVNAWAPSTSTPMRAASFSSSARSRATSARAGVVSAPTSMSGSVPAALVSSRRQRSTKAPTDRSPASATSSVTSWVNFASAARAASMSVCTRMLCGPSRPSSISSIRTSSRTASSVEMSMSMRLSASSASHDRTTARSCSTSEVSASSLMSGSARTALSMAPRMDRAKLPCESWNVRSMPCSSLPREARAESMSKSTSMVRSWIAIRSSRIRRTARRPSSASMDTPTVCLDSDAIAARTSATSARAPVLSPSMSASGRLRRAACSSALKVLANAPPAFLPFFADSSSGSDSSTPSSMESLISFLTSSSKALPTRSPISLPALSASGRMSLSISLTKSFAEGRTST